MQIELTPEQVAACIDEVGFGFMFAPQAPPGDGARDSGPQGARGPHDLQFPGPAHQSRRCGRQLLGVSDRSFQETIAEALSALAAITRWWFPPTTGSTSSASPPDPGDRGRGRGHGGVVRRGRGARPRHGAARRDRRREPGRTTPQSSGRCSPARQGPQRDVALLNAGAAIYVGGRRGGPQRRRRAGTRGDRLGRRAARCSTRLVDRSRALAAAS